MIAAFQRRRDVLLFTDWTLLRLFPPLRSLWARIGQQAQVPITGHNARGVLFGAINVRTACRTLYQASKAGAHAACQFLRRLRSVYRRAGTLWLLADRASGHTAKVTQELAARAAYSLCVAAQAMLRAQRDGSVVARTEASDRRQSAGRLD